MTTSPANGAPAQTAAAGYAVLRPVDESRRRPVHLDVWYPTTDGPEARHVYGLGAGRVVHDAPVPPGRFPVLLVSHGAMGSASNYSWLAEHMARAGFVVLGVSHFAESPVFGLDSVEPGAATRFGDRTRDLNFGLDYLFTRSPYVPHVDPSRLAIAGHSSGGASALMMAGVEFRPADLAAYCASERASEDMGCRYANGGGSDRTPQTPEPSRHPVRALVVMDPAVGPGFPIAALGALSQPILVIGSVANDFLPYDAHAGRVARAAPRGELLRLASGEGHFVYLDACSAPIDAMGVELCSDRPGVDRKAVHRRLSAAIAEFLGRHLA